jgi:hypothetical protein
MKNKDDDTVKNDFDYSRETYYDLLEKGREAMEDMIHVARESEHPRAYEVLFSGIKHLSDVNDKLMDLNKKNKDIASKDQPKQVENQQNNFFVGSTTELQKMLQQQNEKIINGDSTE